MPYKNLEVRKAKHREYAKKYYEANKEKIIAASGKARKKERVEFASFKSRLSCARKSVV